jgi:hypothetical protein
MYTNKKQNQKRQQQMQQMQLQQSKILNKLTSPQPQHQTQTHKWYCHQNITKHNQTPKRHL